MPEHLKKIVLPLADGGRQEIEVAEKARLDAIEAALAPNLLPGDGSGMTQGSVSLTEASTRGEAGSL